MLLVAFLLNLAKFLSQDSWLYLGLNVLGAALAASPSRAISSRMYPRWADGVTMARMSIARIMTLMIPVILAAASAAAQVPADLRAAMEGRDHAFYAADAAQWERYTAPSFSTVQQDGSFFTRAERLANLKTQPKRTYVARSREQNIQRGDIVIARFFSSGLWVIEV